MENFKITTFYKFHNFAKDQLESIRKNLLAKAETLGVYGLMIMGTEGLNTTLAGKHEALDAYVGFVKELLEVLELNNKDSYSDFLPFKDIQIKIKDEIVTLGRTDIVPQKTEHRHLKTEEWNQALQDGATVIDTRNWYETDIGKFKNAVDFRIEDFQEFSQKLKESDIPKDQKVLIYCTGGVRCEKAIYNLEEQGYHNSYQLDGGILRYMEECPEGHWEGECFVFDKRVAVDKDLKPSTQYTFCPHCGQPAHETIECIRCETATKICPSCLEKGTHYQTCSKNCAHHTRMGSRIRTKVQTKIPSKDLLLTR